MARSLSASLLLTGRYLAIANSLKGTHETVADSAEFGQERAFVSQVQLRSSGRSTCGPHRVAASHHTTRAMRSLRRHVAAARPKDKASRMTRSISYEPDLRINYLVEELLSDSG